MKTFLFCLLACMTSVVYGQNSSAKLYTVVVMTTDFSVQSIVLSADDACNAEFLRIARENRNHLTPVSLNYKTFYAGQKVSVTEDGCISETEAYAFLANQFCKVCACEKVVNKNTATVILVKTNEGNKIKAEVSWLPNASKWYIRLNYFYRDMELPAKKTIKLVYL